MSGKIAAQLYTLRDFMKTPKDFARTMKRVSDIGYEAVQISGAACMNGLEPKLPAIDAKKILDDNGLACVATHRGWDSYSEHLDYEIEFHKTLGCDYTAIGSMPSNVFPRNTAGGYEHFLEELEPIIKKLNDAGIQFGYHNHRFEFEKVDGNRTCFDILADANDINLMMEIDLYWLWAGGANPVSIIKRLAGRIPVIHVKDCAIVDNEVQFAAIGEGNLDWDEIVPACDASGVEWYIVEQDTCPRDPFDCLKSSFNYLNPKLEALNLVVWKDSIF